MKNAWFDAELNEKILTRGQMTSMEQILIPPVFSAFPCKIGINCKFQKYQTFKGTKYYLGNYVLVKI